jgi:outer membrane protein assembly factor BamB
MNWSSPALHRDGEDTVVLLQSPGRLTALDPGSGEQRWEHAVGCSVIPSAVSDGKQIYLPAGGLTALAISDGKPKVAWQDNKLGPASASPVALGDRVYTINSAPALTCADAATGEIAWRTRLTGPFWATPLLAGDSLYCVSEKGLAQVVDLAARGKVVSQFDFAEPILASPAASDGAIYFRSDAHLWKISRR